VCSEVGVDGNVIDAKRRVALAPHPWYRSSLLVRSGEGRCAWWNADAHNATTRLARRALASYHPPVTTDRRDFLKHAALAAATASGLTATDALAQGVAPPQQGAARTTTQTAPRALDPLLLRALGDAILPEMLGEAGRTKAIAAFATWLARYTPVAEEMHGYGYAEITYTPSDPAPGWNAQLAGLDLLARRKHRRGFARLGVPLRRAVVETQLARSSVGRLPSNPLAAPHVAVALLAHWAASSEATDLAYEARIMKGNCRLLSETSRAPLPLASTGDA